MLGYGLSQVIKLWWTSVTTAINDFPQFFITHSCEHDSENSLMPPKVIDITQMRSELVVVLNGLLENEE